MNCGPGCQNGNEENVYEDAGKYSAVNIRKVGLVKGTLKISLTDFEKALESETLRNN